MNCEFLIMNCEFLIMNCEFLIMNYEFLFIQSTNYNHERHQLYSIYFWYFASSIIMSCFTITNILQRN